MVSYAVIDFFSFKYFNYVPQKGAIVIQKPDWMRIGIRSWAYKHGADQQVVAIHSKLEYLSTTFLVKTFSSSSSYTTNHILRLNCHCTSSKYATSK